MALPWLTALKIIPWKDVVEAAPAVLAAAKGLRKDKTPPAPQAPATPLSADEATQRLQQQLADQEQRLQALQTTVSELAEHNLRLVATVDVLRTRSRWLMAGCTVALVLALVLGWRVTG